MNGRSEEGARGEATVLAQDPPLEVRAQAAAMVPVAVGLLMEANDQALVTVPGEARALAEIVRGTAFGLKVVLAPAAVLPVAVLPVTPNRALSPGIPDPSGASRVLIWDQGRSGGRVGDRIGRRVKTLALIGAARPAVF